MFSRLNNFQQLLVNGLKKTRMSVQEIALKQIKYYPSKTAADSYWFCIR